MHIGPNNRWPGLVNEPAGGGSPPVPVAPNFTSQPTLLGSTALGSTITVSLGAASGTPAPALTGILTRPGKAAAAVLDGDTFHIEAADQGGTITLDVTATNSAGSATASETLEVPVAGAVVGVPIGLVGPAGTIYDGYVLADGDDFDATPDFLTPTQHVGAYMTTRHYGIQSGAPRYLRGAASLGGYEADPWHSGFKDAGRGVVPASFADTITVANGALKLKSRRATAEEKAIMGPLSTKGCLSSMVHMGRRNMMRAPCMMEVRLRFPYALASWNQWHPTFWLLQSQPGNGFDGMELDCEGFGPQLEFYKHKWTNGSAQYGSLLGKTAAVSKTEYRTYGFEIVEVASVWKVRLWENGTLIAETDAGTWFDPKRPFHLMITNHILQQGLTQSVFDAAGDAGADMECDWWRAWMPAAGAFRKPSTPAVQLLADFDAPFSFVLPPPAEVWGAGVTSDVIEMIPNEDNSPAQPWVRGLLPASVTRTGNTLAGRIADQPGRLVLARSATPAAGDGCVPQPITICVGPRITLSDTTITDGDQINLDVYAACDCGDLHMGKQITVTGLAGTGLGYSAQTGLLTGTPPRGAHSITISVTNALGQTATKQITLTVEAAAVQQPDYASWAGPGWYDFSDDATLTLSGADIQAAANKRAGGVPLVGAGTPVTRVAGVQNGRSVARFVRNTTDAARFHASTDGSDPISQMCQGDDKPYTVISVYIPRDTNTGYIWSWSDTVSSKDAQQIAFIRRAANSSIRRQLVTATTNDVTWGAGHPAGVARIVAVRHTGKAVTVWDNALAKAVDGVAQDTAAFNNELIFRLGSFETQGPYDPYIGSMTSGAMDLCEMVIEGEAKSDAEIEQAITYLAAKWGVVLS